MIFSRRKVASCLISEDGALVRNLVKIFQSMLIIHWILRQLNFVFPIVLWFSSLWKDTIADGKFFFIKTSQTQCFYNSENVHKHSYFQIHANQGLWNISMATRGCEIFEDETTVRNFVQICVNVDNSSNAETTRNLHFQ